MKLTKEQLKEAVTTIYEGLSQGQTDKDIIEEMGISADQYEKLKSAMFEAKTEELKARPHEHIYVDYMLAQSGNIRDLTDMISQMHSTKNYAAMVGAVRARSDIIDRLIEKGQQFGIIHKKPDRKEIVAGVMVAELSDKQLKKMILGELGMLNNLRKQFGEKNLADIDRNVELHSGPALPMEKKDEEEEGEIIEATVFDKKDVPRTNKAKTTQVRKGRRTVRKPSPLDLGEK